MIKHIGVATIPVVMNDKTGTFTFFVVKKSKQVILGLQATEALRLVARSVDALDAESFLKVQQEFPELFQGTGCAACPYRMVLREDAIPLMQSARRVPLALREPLREELQRMEAAHIVQRVGEPTDWVSPLVTLRKKDGEMRVCMDTRSIKERLKWEYYQMPK